MKDYYASLGVPGDASIREIKRAYKKLVKKWHPDLHPQDPACRTKILEINEAYEVLSDRAKRRAYDRQVGVGEYLRMKGLVLIPPLQSIPFWRIFLESMRHTERRDLDHRGEAPDSRRI